ncbi:hypothetical protein [Actinacidiphila bryophytorum]|uniref:hypothetical protein n=1 Tax=Actinacidiphila bryophytorum TaxID=1436133 RepID=UPI002176AD13|nr:hypothetical protein [Actinacidiphila bryophytorum]UWE08562.1 hypothetical protein NYE86_07395 [Actinacidiphila bryophytorum]
MRSVRVRSFDGTALVPAEQITALDVVGATLVARAPALGGPFVLAEGSPHELAAAAHSLMPGIDALGPGTHTVRATRTSTGIGWQATTTDDESGTETGGAGWAASSAAPVDKKSWPA